MTEAASAGNANGFLTASLVVAKEQLMPNHGISPTHTQSLPRIEFERKPLSRRLRALVWCMTYGRCYYCGIHTNPWLTYTVDHVIPLCRGGTDDIPNLVPCCSQCNSAKGTRLISEWDPGRPFWFESDDYLHNHQIEHLTTIEDWIWEDNDQDEGGDPSWLG